ncbi:MAG: outer membrane beta-barrel protein [Acidobacteriota bacterium]
MTKQVDLSIVAVTLVLLAPWPAAAQHRHPHAGSVAVGFDVGVYVPDEDFHTGFLTQGLAEYYLTPNVSLRGTGGWSKTEFKGQSELFLEQARGAVNVLFNWERGLWHPFITAGGGFYSIRDYRDDSYDPGWVWRTGMNFGGGVEHFSTPSVTIKVEGVYHWVAENHPRGEPRGFALTAGLKKYF